VRSVAAGQEYYECVGLSHSCDLRQRGVRKSVRANITLVSPIERALPTSRDQSFQEHRSLSGPILPCL
jgi:hypothetical protein